MAKKEDIRVTKTKRDLRKALAALMEHKEFDKITVCDICEEAMINRMTFYKHYMDKYDLLSDVLDYTTMQLRSELATDKAKKLFEDDPSAFFSFAIERIVDLCAEKEAFFRVVTTSENSVIRQMIYDSMRKAFVEFIGEYCKDRKSKYPVETLAVFLTGGVSHLTVYSLVSSEDGRTRQERIDDCKSFFKDFLFSDLFFESEPENAAEISM